MSGVATALAAGATATTAAIVGAGVVTAGATIYASDQAASATKDATNAAIAQQQQALQQQAQLSAPYRNLGESAMGAYKNLLGIGANGQIDPRLAQQTLAQMPGYQFQLEQGNRNTLQQAQAMGLGLSGNTLEALSRYNQGLASTSYNQELQNLLAPVGIGQAAAAGQAANVGQAGANISNALIGQGQNLANIKMGEAAGVANAIGGGINQYTTLNTLQALQNPGVSPYAGGASPFMSGTPASIASYTAPTIGNFSMPEVSMPVI